jgi:hypothetical protein
MGALVSEHHEPELADFARPPQLVRELAEEQQRNFFARSGRWRASSAVSSTAE